MAKAATATTMPDGDAPPTVGVPESDSELMPSRKVSVERTSLGNRNDSMGEVTLRFNRWHAHGNTAYQKGQFAGFSRPEAQRLIASGVAILAETAEQRRNAADRFMITK
jgi:hypothetical protein